MELSRLDDATRNILKGDIFRAIRRKLSVCLAAGQCPNPAIDAHSVPNANALRRLARDGHVLELTNRHVNSKPVIDFYKVGVRDASVFRGLCADHDSQIFDPVDQHDFDIHDPKNLFLISYRAFLRELYQKLLLLRTVGDLDRVVKKRLAAPAGAVSKGDLLIRLEMQRLVVPAIYNETLETPTRIQFHAKGNHN